MSQGNSAIENANQKATSAIARKRWKLLSSAIAKPATSSRDQCKESNEAIRFPNYGLVEIIEGDGDEEDVKWCQVKSKDSRFKFNFKVCLLRPDFSARDLIGFNNTGNVCVWPAEECMATYCLERSGEIFDGRKRVVELGGGMTCLAALILAKAIPRLDSVLLTDGNEASVDNLRAILVENGDLRGRVSAQILRWSKSPRADLRAAFDVVLCADCLFFDEFRLPLAECMAALLKPSGVAVVMAPKRGRTFADFVSKARESFATVREDERYSERIWDRRQELTADERFREDIHYPVLLTLTQPRPSLTCNL